MTKKKNYIDNRRLYECMLEYADRRKAAEAAGRPRPPMPEYAGECISLLCKRMGTRGNFAGYTFRDELVGDAILDCCAAFYNFDPYRFNNPFGYFSRVGWRAMVRRIFTEKRETYAKHKSFQMAMIAGEHWDSPEDYVDAGADRKGSQSTSTGRDVSDRVVSEFEALLERRKKAKEERSAT